MKCQDDMVKALQSIEDKSFKGCENIQYTKTLSYRVSGKSKTDRTGRPINFRRGETLENYIQNMESICQSLTITTIKVFA